MPYRSARQRAFMHARKPGIAARWDKKYGGRIVRKSSSGNNSTRRSTRK